MLFIVDSGSEFVYSVRAMKKRLRKKYRVGEFRELCFEFVFEYKGDVDSAECEQFLQNFVEQCIDANNLDCEGLLSPQDDSTIVGSIVARGVDPTKTNNEQREAVKAWLEAQEDLEIKAFGELVDAWYGTDL